MASMTSAGVPVSVRAARDLYLVAIAVFVVNIVMPSGPRSSSTLPTAP